MKAEGPFPRFYATDDPWRGPFTFVIVCPFRGFTFRHTKGVLRWWAWDVRYSKFGPEVREIGVEEARERVER